MNRSYIVKDISETEHLLLKDGYKTEYDFIIESWPVEIITGVKYICESWVKGYYNIDQIINIINNMIEELDL